MENVHTLSKCDCPFGLSPYFCFPHPSTLRYLPLLTHQIKLYNKQLKYCMQDLNWRDHSQTPYDVDISALNSKIINAISFLWTNWCLYVNKHMWRTENNIPTLMRMTNGFSPSKNKPTFDFLDKVYLISSKRRKGQCLHNSLIDKPFNNMHSAHICWLQSWKSSQVFLALVK